MSADTLFSVAGGKYHRPAANTISRPWSPTLTACGITVTPLNYFASDADANRHTGGRLSSFAGTVGTNRERRPRNKIAETARSSQDCCADFSCPDRWPVLFSNHRNGPKRTQMTFLTDLYKIFTLSLTNDFWKEVTI